jgi:hypothetical protein
MPWVNKLVWENPEWENEELPLWKRKELAWHAGQRVRAQELHELDRGIDAFLDSPSHQLDELARSAARHTNDLPASEPVNPGLDFVRRYGGGGN